MTSKQHNAAEFSKKYRLGSPFDLDDDTAYHAWLDYKLNDYPKSIEDIIVEINDTRNPSKAEIDAITALNRKTNMAIYAGNTGSDADKSIAITLARHFGLTNPDDNMGADDGITTLKVVSDDWHREYIPYTNRLIHWHTDGYYNAANQQIQALMLHCVSPASKGGENALLDHEIAYIRLRQANPEYVMALMKPDAMTIPANINKKGDVIRPDRVGPVFSIMPDGNLHMRYTARTRSIKWKRNRVTQEAVATLTDYLHSDSPYIYRGTLQSGQGLISNNVLHDRSGFSDEGENKRTLYRLRYFQRVADS